MRDQLTTASPSAVLRLLPLIEVKHFPEFFGHAWPGPIPQCTSRLTRMIPLDYCRLSLMGFSEIDEGSTVRIDLAARHCHHGD
jgi:hypothetical protein